MRKGRLPARDAEVAPGCSKLPTAVRCFWMRLAKCRYLCRLACYGCWKKKEVTRVGGHQPVPVDVRVISATHCNLEEDMRQGQFRRDLFYRLSILRLQLPPLRERVADILPLAESFFESVSGGALRPIFCCITPGVTGK